MIAKGQQRAMIFHRLKLILRSREERTWRYFERDYHTIATQ